VLVPCAAAAKRLSCSTKLEGCAPSSSASATNASNSSCSGYIPARSRLGRGAFRPDSSARRSFRKEVATRPISNSDASLPARPAICFVIDGEMVVSSFPPARFSIELKTMRPMFRLRPMPT